MTGWHWFATPDGAAALAVHARGPVAVRRIIEAAVEAERGAVVAWLRADIEDHIEDGYAIDVTRHHIAAIERGEHRP